MGYHQSRWGVKNVKQIIDIASQYDIHGIPFDGFFENNSLLKYFFKLFISISTICTKHKCYN